MALAKQPAWVHWMYAIGLVIIVAFVLVAWGYTAYSLSAPILPENADHQPSVPFTECARCHQSDPRAPRIPHADFPSCGYCHRLPVRFPPLTPIPTR